MRNDRLPLRSANPSSRFCPTGLPNPANSKEESGEVFDSGGGRPPRLMRGRPGEGTVPCSRRANRDEAEALELSAELRIRRPCRPALEVTGKRMGGSRRILEPQRRARDRVSPSDTGIRKARRTPTARPPRALDEAWQAGHSTASGAPTSGSARCAAGSRAVRSSCGPARRAKKRSTRCSSAG